MLCLHYKIYKETAEKGNAERSTKRVNQLFEVLTADYYATFFISTTDFHRYSIQSDSIVTNVLIYKEVLCNHLDSWLQVH